ncbi:MAG: LysR substrate-binding domain-containing protein [Ideonella sp.]|jgi:DNA-binding transcriptional LysR family regulator|nr:LysR substrate-binding domain-containing protein [Ideonella sp.]
MEGVTLRQLRVLVAVARHLSVTRAAEELGLTPPAVSMQLKALERQVGLPLFDRTGRAVTLTSTGEYLLSYARRVLATLKDADDAMARLRGLQGGRVTIGIVGTAQYFMPRLVADFQADHPGVDLQLRAGPRDLVVTLLQRHEVDLAVMGRPPRDAATHAEPFALHPHVLVTPPRHPFATMPQVPLVALAREGFIVREPGSGTRAAFDEFGAEHQLVPRVLMEMDANETIKQAVMAGMGVSLLSLHTVGLELQHGLLATPEVEGLPIVRRWYVVRNQGKLLSPAAEALHDFVLQRGEGLLGEMFPLTVAGAALRRFGLRSAGPGAAAGGAPGG